MLDKYRNESDKHIVILVKRLGRFTPNMFVFLQYPVDPTDMQQSAHCYAVVFRKISGQIHGAQSMRRMSNIMTCVLTWRAHGKNIVEEVMTRI